MKLFDTFSENGTEEQRHAAYERGLRFGETAQGVTIAINDVWGAVLYDGARVSSYEKVGYHAGATWFIAGVLDSHCPVSVARLNEQGKITWHELEKV